MNEEAMPQWPDLENTTVAVGADNTRLLYELLKLDVSGGAEGKVLVQMHFHLEALKPTWQTTFNSKSLPTDPKKAWPANQWVPLDGDRVLAKFVPSSGSAPTQISPFEEWRSAYEKVKISKGYP